MKKITVNIAVIEKLTTMFEAIVLDTKGKILDKKYETSKYGLAVEYTLELECVNDLYIIGKGIGYYEKMTDDEKIN